MAIPVMKEERISVVHREDVKAALCKRYGTLDAAATKLGFKATQLRDYLAGRSKAQHDIVARELGFEPDHLKIVSGIVPKCGDKNHNEQDEAA